MATSSTRLCALHSIEEFSSRGFELERGNQKISLFVVKKKQQVFVYKNSCPHIGIPLEWTEDQFLTSDKSLIICANHGALFAIETGECISGPCNGQHLAPIAHEIMNGDIHIHL